MQYIRLLALAWIVSFNISFVAAQDYSDPCEGACTGNSFCCAVDLGCKQNKEACGDKKVCNGGLIAPNSCCPDAGEVCCNGQEIPDTAICLLQPPPGVGQSISTDPSSSDPFQYWQSYFGSVGGETLWTWGLWMGVGLAVLNVVVAGFEIMGGESMGLISDGKQRMMWSIVGLMMLLFAGTLLSFLNPLFFLAG